MATLTKQDVIAALTRLGQLAQKQNETIELVLLGGSLMVLLFGTRESTRDVDVLILAPPDIQRVRDMAKSVAIEQTWPDDWLNDAAKGFMIGLEQFQLSRSGHLYHATPPTNSAWIERNCSAGAH